MLSILPKGQEHQELRNQHYPDEDGPAHHGHAGARILMMVTTKLRASKMDDTPSI